ncbi:MAG: AbrB/MazE/SpoVT family DNA-binding domain-containing protein [Planctomycetota bacterium]|jgi:bifunctional DNA-binding transcriptional regulator/antitoxin component of YhaV-PrlF toxin-antitoxin module
MSVVKVSARRQAVLPKQLCEEMQIGAGDSIEVEPITHGGETLWAIRPLPTRDLSAVGSLKKYARKRQAGAEAVRESIVKRMKEEDLG